MTKSKKKEDPFAVFSGGPSEKLRMQLLKEEFKKRKVQPTSWTKVKYRKLVKLPKDFLPPSERKKKRKKGEQAEPMKREDYFKALSVRSKWTDGKVVVHKTKYKKPKKSSISRQPVSD